MLNKIKSFLFGSARKHLFESWISGLKGKLTHDELSILDMKYKSIFAKLELKGLEKIEDAEQKVKELAKDLGENFESLTGDVSKYYAKTKKGGESLLEKQAEGALKKVNELLDKIDKKLDK